MVFFAGPSETATLTNTFTVTSGATTTPTDPTTVTLTVVDPLGVVTSYTYAAAQITRLSAGAYTKDIVVPTAGEWSFTWAGTGTVPDVVAGTFTVLDATALGRLYATPQQLRSRVGLPATDTTLDAELHSACYAASRAVENYCQRVFWRGTDTRAIEARGTRSLQLGAWNDLVSLSALATDLDGDGVFETTWAGTDYELGPVNRSGPEQRPYTSITALGVFTFPALARTAYGRRSRVQISGVFGWPAVPAAVTEAARIMAAELFKLKDAPFGIASFGEYGAVRIRRNPMLADLLDPYVHPDSWVA